MSDMVPRAGVEPARPCGHYALNVARLPFRHLGNLSSMVNDDPQSTPKNIQRVPIDDPFNLILRYPRQMMILRKLVQPP